MMNVRAFDQSYTAARSCSPLVESAVAERMRCTAACIDHGELVPPDQAIKIGVDLGTAFTTIIVTDAHGAPLAGSMTFADVVRDGIVWDFAGAVDVVRGLKVRVERQIGRPIKRAAVTIPPSVGQADHRAHRYVLEGSGIECTAVVDEPTAANAVLRVQEGAVVDVGGGTTGVAIVRSGRVVRTFDEPSGGWHLTLVVAGAMHLSVEDAELYKRDRAHHQALLPMLTPVVEKLATIVRDGIRGEAIKHVYLVGGTVALAGVDAIMTRVIKIPCEVVPEPMLVTPLGVASFA